MEKSRKCDRCGVDLARVESVRFGAGELCFPCAEKMEDEPGKCPVCGTVFNVLFFDNFQYGLLEGLKRHIG